ncbi:MAG: amidohydrolase family protein [Qipengyuania citrea]|jgi:imidazolonepropionase-like amidohydrolase|uniref:metal-dependent hydrolase family protein n=1 Tax=Erythrobacteraceae TaxID=335929 RepID=UPI0007B8D153|nr:MULTISPECIES: amidohydrolase family protein [unclassified Erythrobacter]MBN91172.1 amidohydrolase family protein [Erythrobacteraceae bacterium]HBC15326.1 amidohydrolase family protein [Erythrobacter sp.]KZX89856.1 Xaa-Pro dipeptidase [Erythrobacter sp. HI0019]KZY06357.1 Xaa-Pro dipeptidase [Erythrobacter sp. HI0028]HBM06022.1 amidohydrolase family protein [Erythrobacter sp.]|tara:strand:- start:1437 stop:2705 length:1269 start_codon:yes stop_codon:yes gene_type:complete
MKIAAFIALAGAMCAAPALADTTVIHAGALVIDAESQPRGPSTITVTDGKIVSVADGFTAAPAQAVTVDLKDKTVVPGMVDLHVHLTGDPGGDFWKGAVEPDEWDVVVGAKNARLTALAGFTTVREAGSGPASAFSLRRGTAEGFIDGPRIVAAGPSLAIVGGHGDVSGFRPEVNELLDSGFTCTGAVECAEKVRLASQNGADIIKITATGGVLSQQGRGLEAHFTSAEMKSIADTAHSLGLKVMAHAHGARGIEAAARAGIDSIEHGTYLDEAAARAMKDNGTVLVPTLMAFKGVTERLGQGVYTPVVEDKIRDVAETARVFMGKALRWGVPIAFGTDAGVFGHGRNAGEFALMVEQGMSHRDAFAAATTHAARVLGLENEIGRIAPGYSADLIAVEANPLDDTSTLENVDWVMVRGRVID